MRGHPPRMPGNSRWKPGAKMPGGLMVECSRIPLLKRGQFELNCAVDVKTAGSARARLRGNLCDGFKGRSSPMNMPLVSCICLTYGGAPTCQHLVDAASGLPPAERRSHSSVRWDAMNSFCCWP